MLPFSELFHRKASPHAGSQRTTSIAPGSVPNYPKTQCHQHTSKFSGPEITLTPKRRINQRRHGRRSKVKYPRNHRAGLASGEATGWAGFGGGGGGGASHLPGRRGKMWQHFGIVWKARAVQWKVSWPQRKSEMSKIGWSTLLWHYDVTCLV